MTRPTQSTTAEQRGNRREIVKAARWIEASRSLAAMTAIVALVTMCLDPTGGVLGGLAFVLATVGWFRLRRNPLPWTVGIALVWTALSATYLVSGLLTGILVAALEQGRLSVLFGALVPLLWTAALWYAAYSLRRAVQLVEADPELAETWETIRTGVRRRDRERAKRPDAPRRSKRPR